MSGVLPADEGTSLIVRDADEFTRVVIRMRGSGPQELVHTFERAIATIKDRPRHVVVDEPDGTRTMIPFDLVRKIVVHPYAGVTEKERALAAAGEP